MKDQQQSYLSKAGRLLINPSYYIAFMPSKGIYSYFEKKGFNHCFIFWPYDGDMETAKFICIIEHTKTFINVGLVEKEAFKRYISKGFYIEVEAKRDLKARWYWWIPTPNTCVTICKQILGIRKPFIWSPYQLYKYLRS